jgi:gliding motility-associated-like protein
VRKKLPGLLLIFSCFTHSISCFATHIFGGELLYTYISGNKYAITMTLYGDCAASSTVFNTLYAAIPLINVYNGTINDTAFRLSPKTVGIEVSPVCPSQIGLTSCNGGTLPGVKQFIYTDTITLRDTSAHWRFIFSGDMGGSNTSGRSTSITNIVNPGGGSLIDLEADLNNAMGPNSSPGYSTIPTPFYCVHVLQQYNQGAIDPDGDSLAFNLVPGIDGASGFDVSYISPYTPTDPVATDSAGFGFNPLNGQITFTPGITQRGLVVCAVSEYRGGVLVGTSEREITFVVLNSCTGTPPNLIIDNLEGGKITSTSASGNNVINICAGTPNLSFGISIKNPDGDNIAMSDRALPGASSLTISNNNSPAPSLYFNWATAGTPPGIYTFFVTIKNDHCPISSTQTIAYTINVTGIPTLSDSLLYPTQCVHQAYMQYNLSGGYLPRTLTILSGGTTILTYKDTTGVIKDSLPAGNYTAIASSDPQCTTPAENITITDSGNLPLYPFSVSICHGDSMQPIYFPIAGPGAIITWYDAKNNALTNPPIPNTTAIGTYTWYVSEQYKKCSSLHNLVTAVVHPQPIAVIINLPRTICYGDTMYLEATGGTQYTWSPQEVIYTDMFGKLYTSLFTTVTLTVNVADRYGCTDSTSVTLSNIQPCCNFAYPTAFTPNGDGKNDGFRVIDYGNMQSYDLTVFNRFGQVVFESKDPRQYWDGKFHGVPCELGTYFYYAKGACLTGKSLEYKGDVILIR